MSDSDKLVEDIRSLNVSGESNDDKALDNLRSGKQQQGGHKTVTYSCKEGGQTHLFRIVGHQKVIILLFTIPMPQK